MLKFKLPVAPSLNNAYANVRGRGRTKTTLYRRWIRSADDYYVLQALQREEKITVPYTCVMTFPKGLRGDVHNRGKIVLDWMVSRELTIDDRHCLDTRIKIGDVDMVEIEVKPA